MKLYQLNRKFTLDIKLFRHFVLNVSLSSFYATLYYLLVFALNAVPYCNAASISYFVVIKIAAISKKYLLTSIITLKKWNFENFFSQFFVKFKVCETWFSLWPLTGKGFPKRLVEYAFLHTFHFYFQRLTSLLRFSLQNWL